MSRTGSRLRSGRSQGHLPTLTEALAAIGQAVYAVDLGDIIKIGWTSDLGQRMHSLGTQRVIGIIPGATRADETELHRTLAGHAIRGREWYPSDDPAVIAVVDQMRTALGVPALA